MKYFYVVTTCVFMMMSCSDSKKGEEKTTIAGQLIDITNNEDKGIKDILELYGGECQYSIGKTAGINGFIKYFKIELSGSSMIDNWQYPLEIPGKGIPYLFFRNLQDERDNYDEIRLQIIHSDGKKSSFTSTIKELELIDEKIILVDSVINTLKNKDYNNFNNLLNDNWSGHLEHTKQEYSDHLSQSDGQFGDINNVFLFGYLLQNNSDSSKMLHVSGHLIRDIQSHNFSVDIDINSDDGTIIYMGYEM